jgi:hypothetical protein
MLLFLYNCDCYCKKNLHRCSLGLIFAKPEKRMVFVVEYVIIDIAFMKTLKRRCNIEHFDAVRSEESCEWV